MDLLVTLYLNGFLDSSLGTEGMQQAIVTVAVGGIASCMLYKIYF